MTYAPNNIFAKILRGEIPSNFIYESQHCVAFEDIAPQAAIHILIIPRGAYKDLTDFTTQASEDEILDFNKAIAATIKKYNLKENGYRAVYNSGDHGGQEVPHLHMHILGGEKLPPMIGG